MKLTYRFLLLFLVIGRLTAEAQTPLANYHEAYRPQIHFSPLGHWMNDPNGMVYHKGIYHLFFQYYPDNSVWGPMHWGHATSTDLVHWQQQPIALYPDSLGYIFSGSAVVDKLNTSGFGKNGKAPLVAIFTHHDPKGEKVGTNTFQNQSIAYSLDDGKTWTKYSGNPVVKNPGARDFRDPKVMWFEARKRWIMTLATGDHVTFFSSPDLKNWNKESEFGATLGAHGGVWECPDLFKLICNGKAYWILLTNINPGGPNGGSATQYFIGRFDGKIFKPITKTTHWLDYGPDEYAGVTWCNTGNRKIFLGWMSNWLYADKVPTEQWRSAMTVPRNLLLKQVNGKLLLASTPVEELSTLNNGVKTFARIPVMGSENNPQKVGKLPAQYMLKFNAAQIKTYRISLSNNDGDVLHVGYDQQNNQYYIDRTAAGDTSFYKGFAGVFKAPRLSSSPATDLTIVADATSVEVFADGGLTTMTCIFFPRSKAPLNNLELQSRGRFTVQKFSVTALKSIW